MNNSTCLEKMQPGTFLKVPGILILCCFFSLVTNAQNVGIGTQNPQSKLHVAGGVRIDTLANSVDSGLVRFDKYGQVSGIKFSGNANQVLTGNGTFGEFTSGRPTGPAGGDLNGSYPNPSIATQAVVTNKLGNGAVTNQKIAPGAVTNDKIADNSITSSKIVDGSITLAKLAPDVPLGSGGSPSGAAGGDLAGNYPNPSIGNGAVTNAKLADNAVTSSKILDNSITSSKLIDNSITSGKVADGSISLSKLGADVILGINGNPIGPAGGDLTGDYPNPVIMDGVVNTDKLATNAVTNTKISDAAVTSSKLANNSVINSKLADNAVSTSKIQDNSVSSSKLIDNSITSGKVADGSISLSKLGPDVILGINGNPIGPAGGDLSGDYPNPSIMDGAVNGDKLATNAVTNAKIADNAVTNTKLANNSVNSLKIADNAITTTKVVDGSITMAKLGPDVILGGGGSPTGPAGGDLAGTYPNPTIGAGTVNSTKLADNAITTTKITDASVTAAKLAAGVIPTTLPPSGTAGGELAGTYPNPSIGTGVVTTAKLADNAVTTAKVLDGSITMAKLGPDVILGGGGSPTGPAGGDLAGTYPNPTIGAGTVNSSKLADNAITTTKITDASVTAAKLAAGVIPTSLPPSGAAGGDLGGSFPNPSVLKLQGVAVNNTAPLSGQVLKYNGTSWAPGTDLSGGLVLPYNATNTNAGSLFTLTNSGAGAAIEGVNSSANANTIGVYGRIGASNGNLSTAVRGAHAGTGSNGMGVWGSHNGGGKGVYGDAASGNGVHGHATSGNGIFGTSTTGTAGYFDVSNFSSSGDALFAYNVGTGSAMTGISEYGNGIYGITFDAGSVALHGLNVGGGEGILGRNGSNTAAAIIGYNMGTYAGVEGVGEADGATGVLARANVNGTVGGNALVAQIEGSGAGNTAVFKANGVNVARIDKAGRGFFNGGTQASGADVAEAFEVTGDRSAYEAGDVLVISLDKDRTMEKSSGAYSTLVAGVYATKPGLLLTERNAEEDALEDMVPMGVIGVIPTKVCLEGGAIKRGDLVVTSSIPGVAMKADIDKVKPGQVIGKALQEYNGSGVGKINILVSVK